MPPRNEPGHDADSRNPALRTRVPEPLLKAIDRAADLAGMSRSAIVRELLVTGLAKRGLWPPTSAGRRAG